MLKCEHDWCQSVAYEERFGNDRILSFCTNHAVKYDELDRALSAT